MYYHYTYTFPIGKITLACNEKNIVGLWLENQRFYMDILTGKEAIEKETDTIRLAKRWLDRYFNNERPGIDSLPLELIGSDFRKQVWEILAQIPYGQTRTYGDIAKQIAGQRQIPAMSARAVGGAVGHNPISIIIPCHRVMGANGKPTGYAGGIDTKQKLLAFEGAYRI